MFNSLKFGFNDRLSRNLSALNLNLWAAAWIPGRDPDMRGCVLAIYRVGGDLYHSRNSIFVFLLSVDIQLLHLHPYRNTWSPQYQFIRLHCRIISSQTFRSIEIRWKQRTEKIIMCVILLLTLKRSIWHVSRCVIKQTHVNFIRS